MNRRLLGMLVSGVVLLGTAVIPSRKRWSSVAINSTLALKSLVPSDSATPP